MAPYLTLMKEEVPQRQHSPRAVFNALRWVVERSFGWVARFRRPARDFERMPHVLEALHFVVFAILMLPKVVTALATGQDA